MTFFYDVHVPRPLHFVQRGSTVHSSRDHRKISWIRYGHRAHANHYGCGVGTSRQGSPGVGLDITLTAMVARCFSSWMGGCLGTTRYLWKAGWVAELCQPSLVPCCPSHPCFSVSAIRYDQHCRLLAPGGVHSFCLWLTHCRLGRPRGRHGDVHEEVS